MKDGRPFSLDRFANNSGLAIGPLIFIVAILALLAAAIAAGSQSLTGGTGTESAKASASAMMHYADNLASAVQRVFIEHNCNASQINFDNPIISGYTNTNAPADNSCDVFNGNGGAVAYEAPNALWLNPAFSGQTGYGQWFITGGTCISYVGSAPNGCNVVSTDYPILLILPYVQQSICNSITQTVGGTANIISAGSNNYIFSEKFVGSFPVGVRFEIVSGGSLLPGSPYLLEGCAIEPNGGGSPAINTVSYYKVLLAR